MPPAAEATTEVAWPAARHRATSEQSCSSEGARLLSRFSEPLHGGQGVGHAPRGAVAPRARHFSALVARKRSFFRFFFPDAAVGAKRTRSSLGASRLPHSMPGLKGPRLALYWPCRSFEGPAARSRAEGRGRLAKRLFTRNVARHAVTTRDGGFQQNTKQRTMCWPLLTGLVVHRP